ncbi:hypothetical protein AHAS_Ahas13G0293100 [Arachis hypogaea]
MTDNLVNDHNFGLEERTPLKNTDATLKDVPKKKWINNPPTQTQKSWKPSENNKIASNSSNKRPNISGKLKETSTEKLSVDKI